MKGKIGLLASSLLIGLAFIIIPILLSKTIPTDTWIIVLFIIGGLIIIGFGIYSVFK